MESTTIYSSTQSFSNDLITPMSVYSKLNQPQSFFLESVQQGGSVGRHSIIGLTPLIRFQGYTDRVTLTLNAPPQTIKGNPLDILDESMKTIQHETDTPAPIDVGLFGYFGWDIIHAIESLPTPPTHERVFDFQIPRILIVFDHAQQRVFVTACDTKPIQDTAAFDEIKSLFFSPFPDHISPIITHPTALDWNQVTHHWPPEEYMDAVKTAQHFIKEGDIFQTVLSQPFSVPNQKSSLDVYRSLRYINPSPYMFYFDYDSFKLIGSSPEILVKCHNGHATVRPIAGTRRWMGQNKDQLIHSLTSDPKEVAEHVMLVDLGRNDLSRVCDAIQTRDLMTIEQYSHVLHMVTNVEGTVMDATTIDLFRAVFPAGTVSGAPKIRAIHIIHDLEPTPRGTYAGSVGYMSLNGDCDLCIAIRTIVEKKTAYYVQAGAGIVHDSNPESEYNETKIKAQGILMACMVG